MTAPRVILVGGRVPHHAQRSGYAEVARRQGPAAVRASRCRWIPGRIAARLAARAGTEAYGADGIRAEAGAMLAMLVRRRRLVHVLSGETHYRYAGALAGFLGHRILCTYHQPPAILERILPSRAHLRRLAGAIALASNQIPFLADAVGAERVFLVPHGIDTEYFRPPETRPATRTCLCVGHWLRDFGTAREAIAILRRREPSVRVEVVAAPGCARELEGLDGVEVVGGIPDDDLLARYRSAALLLLPLRAAAANNALLEAMACGLPGVVTDTGGVRDYVDETCARLVPLGDAARMAEEALALLSDAARRETLGRAARERALACDWSAVMRKTAEVYAAVAPST